MTDPLVRGAVILARAWYRLVTLGLPADTRERRRQEIDSDLYESSHDEPRSDIRTALQIVWRLSAGAPDDLAWRIEQRRTSVPLLLKVTAGFSCAALLAAGFHVRALTVELPTVGKPIPRMAESNPSPPPPPPPSLERHPAAHVGASYAHVSYRLTGAEPAPVLTRQVRPVYAPVLQAAHVRGTVVITAMLTSQGRVDQVRAVRTSLLFTDVALQAVRQWTFSAPHDAGQGPYALTVTISFGA